MKDRFLIRYYAQSEFARFGDIWRCTKYMRVNSSFGDLANKARVSDAQGPILLVRFRFVADYQSRRGERNLI